MNDDVVRRPTGLRQHAESAGSKARNDPGSMGQEDEPSNPEAADGFEDIRIVSVDVSASSTALPLSGHMNIAFNLSGSAPAEWASYFNVRWTFHIYILKRAAHVCGKHLEVCCIPEELEDFHLPELNKLFGETNLAYRQFLVDKRRNEAQHPTELISRKEKLEQLQRSIKFH